MTFVANIFKARAPHILTAVLLLQAIAFYGFSRSEQVPQAKPLADFSLNSSVWTPVRDQPLDQETLDILKADDTLSRIYLNSQTGERADIFVAYFSTQRTGKTPHSPKNCLPGSGWVPSESSTIDVSIPGLPSRIPVNRYVVSRGQTQSLVLYWYQGHNRVVASEYRAKLYTVLDSIHYRRSDTSLVRIVSPVVNEDTDRATAAGIAFIRALFLPLRNYLPA